MEEFFSAKLRVTGPLPPFYRVAEALWGEDAAYDSDGDSIPPDCTNWRELTLELRMDDDLLGSEDRPRIDIDPTDDDRDVIVVRSSSLDLVERTVEYLSSTGAVFCISRGNESG